jgi:hypothetical protein
VGRDEKLKTDDPNDPNYFGLWEEGNYTGTVLEKNSKPL